MTDAQLAIAEATMSWMQSLTPGLSSLNLITCKVDSSMGSHPRYPGSISECPKLLLRDYKGNNKSRPNGGLTFDWQMSLWYYRAQTPGQEHQELLLADMVLIENLWLGNYNPEPVKAAGCSFVMPIQTVNHNELEHRSGRADFRVSVAEILLGYQSQIS